MTKNLNEKLNGKSIKRIWLMDGCQTSIESGVDKMIDRIEYCYQFCGEYEVHWAICYLDGEEVARYNLSRALGFEWNLTEKWEKK